MQTPMEKDMNTEKINPPIAARKPHTASHLGHTWQDDYFWLRESDNPEVIEYLKSENEYTEAMTSHLQGLQNTLYREMVERIKEDDQSVPEKHGDYYYYYRTETGRDYRIYCRRHGSLDAPEQILLDLNEIALDDSLGNMKQPVSCDNAPASGDNPASPRLEYLQLGAFETSPDHRLLAYSLDTDGSEDYTLFIKDMETGKLYSRKITGTYPYVEWAADNRTLFYTMTDEAKRPYKIMKHRLTADLSPETDNTAPIPTVDNHRSAVAINPDTDTEVFHEKDERFFVGLSSTKNRNWLVICTSSSLTSENWIIPADNPEQKPSLFSPRQQGIKYYIENHGDIFYVLTDHEARNYKLMLTPADKTEMKNWQTFIPHKEDQMIEWLDVFSNHLVIYQRSGGLRRMQVSDHNLQNSHFIDFPDEAYAINMEDNPEYDSETVRFNYSSLITPDTVYDYNMIDRSLHLKKRTEVLGGYTPNNYAVQRLHAVAKDGTRIPLSVAYRKDINPRSANPTLLYGYGSYGMCIEPGFGSTRISLLDRGFIYVIAHIRGGGEMGRLWHDDGKFLNKINTFTDFVASAEFLIEQGYTSSDRLVIQGGSAGGLLMGATVNLRPDLFRLVIAQVPFFDVINTMLDETLPLTTHEYEEWGNPNERQYFEYMLKYSPYDNIRACDYPSMLITAGLNDPRVAYWEPAKWTAKIRATRTDSNPILLKTDMGAGHGGPSGRYEAIREQAFVYSLALSATGTES